MKDAYRNFWKHGMYQTVSDNYANHNLSSQIKEDYNFFIPSNGDGTRYKDITKLQGGVTKPASFIPAQLNGHNMTLVQGVLTNFAKTDKLTDGVDFINVKPAKGSAFAFLEGLKNETIPTDKPLVFSWGDNFSDIDITKLILEHEKKNSGFTIHSILVDENRIKSLGAVEIDSIDNKKVTWFKEKPSATEEINKSKVEELNGQCIASVGPFVISAPVLEWIKDKYTQNPESFKNPDGKGYDFSSMIISPLVDVLNNNKIEDKDGNPLSMRVKIMDKESKWSDLGSEKDFSIAMKNIKKGEYKNLPLEMRSTISKNVDEDGNITFDEKSRFLLEKAKKEYGLDLKNTVSFYQ